MNHFKHFLLINLFINLLNISADFLSVEEKKKIFSFSSSIKDVLTKKFKSSVQLTNHLRSVKEAKHLSVSSLSSVDYKSITFLYSSPEKSSK